jgi:polygalacturonase
LRDAPNWNLHIAKSQDVTVEDLRIVSGRLNSDGINSVNAQRVNIRRCFVRNSDDSIAVKAVDPGSPSKDILVEDCSVWNDWGYALGATYETRSPISGVVFKGCDIHQAGH